MALQQQVNYLQINKILINISVNISITPVHTSPGKAIDSINEINHTGTTSQTGLMETTVLIAANLRHEEGKYGRSVAVDTGESSDKTLHKSRTI